MTSFEYPGNQAWNFNLNCVAVMPQCTSSWILFDISLGFVKILLCLHCIVSLYLWLVCFVSLKILSAIEQKYHIFLFILSNILLYSRFYLVSVLSRFEDKTSVSTKHSILSSAFSRVSTFSSPNSSLDKVSTRGTVFILRTLYWNRMP